MPVVMMPTCRWPLGAASILSQRLEGSNGSVKFIFQPGEEVAGGAKAMLDDGAFENPE